MRYATLKDIDDAGHDIRLWCFACGRGVRMDSNIWMVLQQRGQAIALDAATPRFRCTGCRSAASVLILPATRPPSSTTPADLIAGYFHAMRAAGKKAKRR